ncbi:MAG: hypothetical protein AABZ60_21030 [Planctomycetota bacterium]
MTQKPFSLKQQKEFWILLVFFLCIACYFLWPASAESMIRKQLKALASLCSFTQKSGIIQASLASEQLDHFFTGNVSVVLKSPYLMTITGIGDIKSKFILAHTKFLENLTIDFRDIQFSSLSSNSAVVSCTLELAGVGSGENFKEFQEAELQLQQIDQYWKISHIKQVKAIE